MEFERIFSKIPTKRAVSNAKFEAARFRGSADLGKKRRSWGREAYLHTSRPQNGGKKVRLKLKSVRISTL